MKNCTDLNLSSEVVYISIIRVFYMSLRLLGSTGEIENKTSELCNTLLMSRAKDNNLIKKQNQLSLSDPIG